jgi:hypothetical protein
MHSSTPFRLFRCPLSVHDSPAFIVCYKHWKEIGNEEQSKQFCQWRQFIEGVPAGDEGARNARLEVPVAQERAWQPPLPPSDIIALLRLFLLFVSGRFEITQSDYFEMWQRR